MAKISRIDRYASCGAYGHAWYEIEDFEWKPQYGVPLVLACARCGTQRHDSIGTYGQVIQRNYEYPLEYSYHGEPRPDREEFRLAVLRRRDHNEMEEGAVDSGGSFNRAAEER